ncbi:MAG: aspartate aminotransferase family protein [Phycisphaerae bacterium]
MSTQAQIVTDSQKVLIENYGRLPMAVVRGEIARLWDADGKEYLDFFAGFGAGGVGGHCHPVITAAIKAQADTLLSHGNLLTSPPQVELAEKITAHGFGGKVFFCHSGAEADEAALKLCRLAAGQGRYKIISFDGCFHGRTMGGLSLSPESFQAGFEPMLPGNVKVPYGDLDALSAAMDDETAGVFVEPIQGEGGLNVPTAEFMQGVRRLCSEAGILMVVDEVWTAPARTGKWFAYQHFGVEPDAMCLAKAIGGGAPVGAMVAAEGVADVLGPGTHGCTMGGNPLCAAAGAAAMRLIEDENLVEAADTKGAKVVEMIESANLSCVSDVRGKGLMVGMKLDDAKPAKDVMLACLERGLILCIAKQNVVRIAPPLVTAEADIEKGVGILIDVLRG